VGERPVPLAARRVELAEKFDEMEPQGMYRWAEQPDSEVHQMEKQSENESDDRTTHRTSQAVGDCSQQNRRCADGHYADIRENVA
jgi:hypothetical protein